MRKPGLNVQEVINEVKLSVIRQASSVHHVQTPAILRSIGWDVRVLGGSWSGQARVSVPETRSRNLRAAECAARGCGAVRRLGASPAARRCRRHHGALSSADASVLRSLSAASLRPRASRRRCGREAETARVRSPAGFSRTRSGRASNRLGSTPHWPREWIRI